MTTDKSNQSRLSEGELSLEEMIILSEEQGQQPIELEEEEDDELFFIDEEDITVNGGVNFSPTSRDENGEVSQLPISGEGELDDFLVISETNQFEVTVEVDGYNVVDDTYQNLAGSTNELTHVSAYKRNGTYVVAVQDYSFKERFDAGVTPTSPPLTLKKFRTEVLV